MGKGVGLDIGTNMIVCAKTDIDDNIKFSMQRDCFYRIVPKTEVNRSSIRMSLDKRGVNYIIDEDGSFVIVGEDALEMAIERNDSAQRPMKRGVISPKDKSSLPMLKLIIESLVGNGDGQKLIYSVPAKPIDNVFDITYHTEMMGMYIRNMGYDASAINEAFAVALSELVDDELTGVAISCLVPGTRIYTDKGIVPIETVLEDDKVITHKGRLRNVDRVVTKNFSGMCTKIKLQGYSNDIENYKFVDNHELYVNRNNEWKWVGCEDVIVGDIVGEPLLNKEVLLNLYNINIIRPSGNFFIDSFYCSRVIDIEYEEYEGIVYDLKVEEDHSFSGPFLTIHNCGAGMTNVCVVHEGDPLVEFSVTRGGDFIDQSVGHALDVSPSLVQLEKEAGTDLFNPTTKIMEAVSVYYTSVISYTMQNISYELKQREKDLPIFRSPVPVVVSGGLTLASGFEKKVETVIKSVNFPIKIGEVRRAQEPMKAVAYGCLLASTL